MPFLYRTSLPQRRAALRSGVLALCCLAMGGCSMSIGGVFGKDDASEEVTGATAQPALSAPVSSVSSSPMPAVNNGAATSPSPVPPSTSSSKATFNSSISSTDWVYARGALGLALTGPENTPPVPWANPDTGSRGNFAPSAPAELRNGVTCRPFIASRTEKAAEQRIEGTACRTAEGHWDISAVKPVL
jgi:hypothetical protein